VEVAWPTPCVTYFINREGSLDFGEPSPGVFNPSLFQVIQGSFDAWTAPTCGALKFVYGGLTCNAEIGFANERIMGGGMNLVVWREDDWEHATDALALTTLTTNPTTGEIRDADVEFNGVHFTFANLSQEDTTQSLVDIRNTMTHEVGHMLGLDHEFLTQDATMFPNALPGEIFKRDLTTDDINGMCTIYPAAAFPNEGACEPEVVIDDSCTIRFEGRVGCASAPIERPTSPPVSLLVLGLCVMGAGCVGGFRRAARR